MKQRSFGTDWFLLIVLLSVLLVGSAVVGGDDPSGGVLSSIDNVPLPVSEGLSQFPEVVEITEPPVSEMLGDSREPVRVNVMPGKFVGPGKPYVWPERTIKLWGNVHNGIPPYTFSWDPGDGSPAVTGSVTNPKFIAVDHSYGSLGIKRAVLTVTDADGASDVDTVVLEVVPQTLTVENEAAIQDGLRFLYLMQSPSGGWHYSSYDVAATAQAVLCFESHGYLPGADYDRSIYAEFVTAGLDYITAYLTARAIGPQGYGDPESPAPGNTDANGIGIYASGSQTMYTTGMVIMALTGSSAPDRVAPNGHATWVQGRTYYDLVVDMVDFYAWAQVESGAGRGGWRYYPNYSSSDNSVTMWAVLGLHAAEDIWGIFAPQFVKDQLLFWIDASRRSDGCFYYSPGYYSYGSVAVTASGMCAMSYCGIPSDDPRWQMAACCLANHWNQTYHLGWYYAMHAVRAACRTAEPESVYELCGIQVSDIYDPFIITRQSASGNWPGGWGVMDHMWALQSLTTYPPPGYAVIDGPDTVSCYRPFLLDGSDVYLADPAHAVVEWRWDFDASDGVDFDNADAAGTVVEHPGVIVPGSEEVQYVIVSLKVYTDHVPPVTMTAQRTIAVLCKCPCSQECLMLPSVQYAFMANMLGPFEWEHPDDSSRTVIIDPMAAPLYVSWSPQEQPLAELDQSTVRINDDIVPVSIDTMVVPILGGAPALALGYNLAEFILSYADSADQIWDTVLACYEVSGQFTDGGLFAACGDVTIIGHHSGDVNSDGVVNVGDLTELVSYLFRGSQPPEPLSAADANHDGRVNVSDMTMLVSQLFGR